MEGEKVAYVERISWLYGSEMSWQRIAWYSCPCHASRLHGNLHGIIVIDKRGTLINIIIFAAAMAAHRAASSCRRS